MPVFLLLPSVYLTFVFLTIACAFLTLVLVLVKTIIMRSPCTLKSKTVCITMFDPHYLF